MQTLNEEHLDSLHREIREHNPDIWEPACQRLGELAAVNQAAYTALCDLLLSSAAELRLRGLVALRTLAPIRPHDVVNFLRARVEDSRVHFDPVLLDAIFFVFAALPNSLGQPVVEDYLADPSPVVRAAAAAALPFWQDWPHGTLTRLAEDPAPEVRAGLIISLKHLEDSGDKVEATEILWASEEDELQSLLSELELPQLLPEENLWPEPLDSEQVEELLHMDEPAPADVSRLEMAIDGNPAKAVELLRPHLNNSGAVFLLEQLSEFCRDASLGLLLRAWIRVLEGPGKEDPRGWLLGILGVLEEQGDSELLHPLREFLRACAHAAECSDGSDFLKWCCAYQVNTAKLALWNPEQLEGLSLSPEAFEWLGHFAQIGVEFQELSLFQLSKLVEDLEQARSRLVSECPRPERDILKTVVKLWLKLLNEESNTLFTGGEN